LDKAFAVNSFEHRGWVAADADASRAQEQNLIGRLVRLARIRDSSR